jgi:RHS repeat-associated protein
MSNKKKRYPYTLDADLSIHTPEQAIPYAYGDANWKDKLTAYHGKAIAYDVIGNPLSYDGWAYTWKAGRMLHSMVRDGVNAEFTYDHTGLRVKKTVNGLVDMDGVMVLQYAYDACGEPVVIEGSMAGTLGRDNPFRYRGYMYDEETGLYGTSTRYYDPEWGRYPTHISDCLNMEGEML